MLKLATIKKLQTWEIASKAILIDSKPVQEKL
jgi:hypothetical protein